MSNLTYEESILAAIDEACNWVSAKKGCRVSVQEHWANWETKVFSPFFCCVWYYCAKDDLKFNIPDCTQWNYLFFSYIREKLNGNSFPTNDYDGYGFIYLPRACYYHQSKQLDININLQELLNKLPKISFTARENRFYRNGDPFLEIIIPYLHQKYPVIFRPKRNFQGKSTANKQILLQKLAEIVTELYSLEEDKSSTVQSLLTFDDSCRGKFIAYDLNNELITKGETMSEVIKQVKEMGRMAEAHFTFVDF